MLNRVNTATSLVKLIAVPAAEDESVVVHAFADVYYTSRLSGRKQQLRQILGLFFDAQHALALGMAAAQFESVSEEKLKEYQNCCGDISLN